MSWDIEKSLAQQKAIEAAEKAERLAKKLKSEATISQAIEENRALAHKLELTPEAFDNLASDPKNFVKYVNLLQSGAVNRPLKSKESLNPNHKTQKTSPTTGIVYDTSNWDPAFKWVKKMKDDEG